MRMQTDDILILPDNEFVGKEKVIIQTAKIMTKDREFLTFSHPLKFNGVQINLDLKRIVLSKESHVGDIFFITNHDVDSTNSRGITRKKLSPKEQYLA